MKKIVSKKKPVKKKSAKKNPVIAKLDSLTSEIIASLTKENYIMKVSNVNLTKFIMKKMNLTHDQIITELLITELQTFVDDNQPHSNTEAICYECGNSWIATHSSSCTELECPKCHKMVNIECLVKGVFENNRKECFNCSKEYCKHRTEPENN